jgi:sugar/nucleoside kinase (ribokinase family)
MSTPPPPVFDFSAVGFLVLDTLCHPAGEEMPPPGGATFVQRIRMTPSGTAGATAMVCAILGLRGQLVSEVGRDDAGDFLVRKLKDHYGVATDLISRNNNGVQTSCSMLPIRSTAARAAFFCPGTASTFEIIPSLSSSSSSPDNTKIDAALNAKIVHLGGTGLLTKFDGEPSLRLLQRAKELGRTTVFDLILANAETTVALVEPLLPYIDYFVPSIEEASALVAGMEKNNNNNDNNNNRRDAPRVAKFFKERGVPNVILTLDEDGVYVDPQEGDAFTIPAHDIKVVDTTGCGDSFTAGVIVGISKGWDLRKTVFFANAVAAQVAMGLGSDGDGILKSMESTEEFMKTVPLKPQDF